MYEDVFNRTLSKKLTNAKKREAKLDAELLAIKKRALELDDARQDMALSVKDIMASLAKVFPLDLKDPNFKDTPNRVARAWIEMFSGLGVKDKDVLGTFFPSGKYNQIILLKDIEYVSMCSHHFMPFTGMAHVGYIPNTSKNNVCGLSKLARLVDKYAIQPQLQERMCQQIMQALKKHIKPSGAMVILEGKHSCLGCRGIKKSRSKMITSAVDGDFHEPGTKQEFLKLVGLDSAD